MLFFLELRIDLFRLDIIQDEVAVRNVHKVVMLVKISRPSLVCDPENKSDLRGTFTIITYCSNRYLHSNFTFPVCRPIRYDAFPSRRLRPADLSRAAFLYVQEDRGPSPYPGPETYLTVVCDLIGYH